MAKLGRILVVEDDERLAALIKKYLQKQGFAVLVESRGDTVADRVEREQPDLIILDLMLPGKDGLAVCRDIRVDFPGPILMLTAREDDMDQVAGLEMGADDYVKKPVEPRVLLARMRALLRRVKEPASEQADLDPAAEQTQELIFGGLHISRPSHTVSLEGEIVALTTAEFELLCYMAVRAGIVVSRENLYENLRGIEYDGLDRSMDVMVSRLRKKLNDDAVSPRRIKTIWGQGYLFAKDAW